MNPNGRRYRGSAWFFGFMVLAALGASVAWMFRTTLRDASQTARLAASLSSGGEAGRGVTALPIQQVGLLQQPIEGAVRGVVRDPDGRPVASATVTLYRAMTAWPEWRSEALVQAVTRDDGAFQFRAEQRHGLLVGFEHARFAGGLVEVPLQAVPLELRLQQGFALRGVVTNDVGALVPNARVAIEAVPGELRRAQVTYTASDGQYKFENIASGPARLTALHESWQPATVPAIVIGDKVRVDLRFARPTMAALRGRVVSASAQTPIADATVQLLPLNQRLGLVETIAARTGADGAFLLNGLPRGSMRLIVRHPDYGAMLRTQQIGAVGADMMVELSPRSMVEGQIGAERFDGVFAGGEVLEIQDVAGQLAYATVAPDGRFRFPTPLSPGLAEIHVVDGRFAFQRSYRSVIDVRVLDAAATELELTVVPAPTVRGRFVDERGQPLAGVTVEFARQLSESARLIGDAAREFDIGTVGNQMARLFGTERRQVLALSGPDGRFEVRGFLPGPLVVRAVRAGFGSRLLRLTMPPPGEPADEADVVLPRGCRIEGHVLRGNRKYVGATVTAVGALGSSSAIADGYGAFVIDDLVPDTYRVRARIPGQPTGSDEIVVTVAADRPGSNVVVALEVGREVRGHVTSNDGQPLGGALVSVRGAPDQVAATDGNGDFVLELPKRDLELQVSLGDRGRQRFVPVAADQQQVDVQLDTPPTCTLLGQVVGLPGKKRLAAALLRLTPIDGDVVRDTRTRWIEMPDGELRWALCPSGRVRIEVWCDGYAPHVEERTLAANDEVALGEVTLEPGSRLRGIVRDAAGHAIANAIVLLGDETDLDLFEPQVHSAVDGGFAIGGVTGRSARLIVRAAGFAARSVDLRLPRDVLSPEPLVVTLERGATIEIAVPRAQLPDGGIVQLWRQGRLLASTELDEFGRAWFANRSAGTYQVQLFGHDMPPHEVVVAPDAQLVRVELDVPAK